mmetsp:Transcript_111145/g.314508  ORF Transcript_111145/g.314508 Transcript_111145/m.314508 type:complete len:204 (+) Transcript_111145:894-1505(+)
MQSSWPSCRRGAAPRRRTGRRSRRSGLGSWLLSRRQSRSSTMTIPWSFFGRPCQAPPPASCRSRRPRPRSGPGRWPRSARLHAMGSQAAQSSTSSPWPCLGSRQASTRSFPWSTRWLQPSSGSRPTMTARRRTARSTWTRRRTSRGGSNCRFRTRRRPFGRWRAPSRSCRRRSRPWRPASSRWTRRWPRRQHSARPSTRHTRT